MITKIINKLILLLAIALLLQLNACKFFGNKPDDVVVAKVYDEYLTRSDIKSVVPPGTAPQDSISLVRNYINNWIKIRLIKHKAEKNLPKEKQDFQKQLDDYRTSLLIFAYEQELIRQKLDTNVTDEQIEAYYNSHKDNFLLKENIVKVLYAKFRLKTPAINQARSLFRSEKESDREKLYDICQKNAVNYFLDDQSWLFFNDVLKEIPIKTYDQEAYLKNNRFIEIQDSLFHYLVNIKGFLIKESLSPLSFEKARVKAMILNARKVELIQQMHDDLFKDAQKSQTFVIY